MCGIIAGNVKTTEIILKESIKSLSNRGPDLQNFVLSNDYFFGHTLLSLFSSDPLKSIQPISSKNYIGCVNGEIYNYYYLRKILEEKGYVFTTESDSEVVIHGLDYFGIDILNKLEGEFCFVSYNIYSKTWICAVDKFGTKPLKYFNSPSKFLIASTIKALTILDPTLRNFDINSILFSFATQVLPDNRTIINDIHTIPPGHYITVTHNSITTTKYLDEQEQSIFDISLIDDLLNQAVLSRIKGHNKVSLALSSGVDSSIIACYLKKNQIDFHCYSVDFVDSQYSEIADITEFVNRHELNHTTIPITSSDLMNHFEQTVLNAESIIFNTHTVGKLLLNKQALSDGYKVMLTGDGADEIFYGYPHLHTDDEYQFITDSEQIGLKYINLLSDECNYQVNVMRNEAPAISIYKNHWLNNYGLKILGDSQSASISQEHRYPFLDNRLTSYINGIHDFRKMNHPSKQVLRTIMKQYDDKQHTMIKKPFFSPVVISNWSELIEKYILENSKLHDLGLFNKNQLRKFMLLNTSGIIVTQLMSLGMLSSHYG